MTKLYVSLDRQLGHDSVVVAEDMDDDIDDGGCHHPCPAEHFSCQVIILSPVQLKTSNNILKSCIV